LFHHYGEIALADSRRLRSTLAVAPVLATHTFEYSYKHTIGTAHLRVPRRWNISLIVWQQRFQHWRQKVIS
jgi:hypothetical protein